MSTFFQMYQDEERLGRSDDKDLEYIVLGSVEGSFKRKDRKTQWHSNT